MIKYYSITDTSDSHLETLKGKLESVAADYFTSFALSEDKLTLTCYDGENPLITFNAYTITSGVKIKSVIISGDNVTQTFDFSPYSNHIFGRIATTKNGCALSIKNVSNNSNNMKYGIFFVKSKKGKTAICIDSDALTVANTSLYKSGWCITSESARISKVTLYTTDTSQLPNALMYTTFQNILCSGIEDYCPYLFVTPSSQCPGTEGIINDNGKKYLYSGAYALLDE